MKQLRRNSRRLIFFMYSDRFRKLKQLKNSVFWGVTPCGSCKNDVSEELSASIIRVTRICELGMLVVTSNRRTLRIFLRSVRHPDEGDKFLRNVGSYKSHTA
jgi:hypothetical protein